MKKLLVFLFALVCAALVGIYLFIPAEIKFSKFIILKTQTPVAARFLMDKEKWMNWFPNDSTNTLTAPGSTDIFKFKNYNYSVESAMMNRAEVTISNDQKLIKTFIGLLPIKEDSVAIEWNGAINAGLNPVSRIKSYYEAKGIQTNMGELVKALQTYLEKKENVYGMSISQEKVVDTILISTKYISNTYPTTREIYSLINDLRKYISEAGAEETNPPMLNIANDNNSYRTMVAIPINKIIPEKGNYVFKRMIPGKILVAQVKGGEHTAMEALKQIDLYITDNNLSSPAIPFESLITNRSQEPDTTKWVTKIYYPIY